MNNSFLSLLPSSEYKTIAPFLEQIFIYPGNKINSGKICMEKIFFVESGAIALSLDDTVFAFIGPGGAFNYYASPSVDESLSYTAFAVFPCRISTLPSEWLRVSTSIPTLQRLIYKEARRQIIQAASAVCSAARHTVEQRVARLLCQLQDLADTSQLAITHDVMATWLGVRRPGVTLAIHILEGENLIRATRGAIQVLDRSGLERATAGAYRPADRLRSMFDISALSIDAKDNQSMKVPAIALSANS